MFSDEIKKQLLISKSKLVFTSSNLVSTVRQACDLPIVEIAESVSILLYIFACFNNRKIPVYGASIVIFIDFYTSK